MMRRPALESLEDRTLLAIPLNAMRWTAIGPAPINQGSPNQPFSGRITGIAAHPTDPNTIYIASAGGGVWKTTDAGSTWNPLTDTQSALFLGSIAVSKSNPSVIYAGEGEANNSGDSFYGRGVLVSTNAGATWTLENDGGVFDRKTVSTIVVDPTDANTVYVAIAGGGTNGIGGSTGIYKSIDGGATWADTTSTISTTNAYSDLVIDPSTPQTLYLAVGTNGGSVNNGVYKTTNGGGLWTLVGTTVPGKTLPNGVTDGRIALAISASTPQTLYVSIAGSGQGGTTYSNLFKMETTTDGGTTWTDLTATTPQYLGAGPNLQGWYSTALAVDPTNSQIVFAGGTTNGGGAGEIETTNGGAAWTPINTDGAGRGPHTDDHAHAFDANNKLLDGNDGGIWRLDNPIPASLQWTDLNGNLEITQFYGIAIDPTTANIAFGGNQDNGTVMFNGSLPWTSVFGNDGATTRINQTNPMIVFQETQSSPTSASIRRSTTGGGSGTYSPITGPFDTDPKDFYVPYVLDPSDSTHLVLGSNKVYESPDSGTTWTAIGGPGFTGWGTVTSNIDTLAIATTDRKTIYVSAASNILVTTNDGTSWTNISIPGGGGINELQVDPFDSKIVYAVSAQFGGGHVFRSANGGTSWTNISANLPNLPTWTLAIDPRTSPEILYVGNDNGVFASFDQGAAWVRFGGGMPNVQVRELELQLHNGVNVLGAGTHGRGMFELQANTPLVVTAITPSGLVEGLPFNNLEVATFTDPNPGMHDAADYGATIDWGDGTTSAGLILEDASGVFHVSGSHTYAEEGTYIITTTVAGDDGASGGASTAPFQVIDAPLSGHAAAIVATEGKALPVTTLLGIFNDTDPGGATSDYTATIDWGDGTGTFSALISQPGGPGLPFDVSTAAILSHTYAEQGTYAFTITIKDVGGSVLVLGGSALVNDAGLAATGVPTPPSLVEGSPFFSGVVATFSDADPNGTVTDYTATINWADGTITNGTVGPGTPGLFNVTGTHTYEEGTFPVSVTIVDSSTGIPGSTVTAVSTFVITDGALTVAPIAPVSATEGQTISAAVGAFTDVNPQATTTDFSVTIDWGDGSAATSGTVTRRTDGTFVVSGVHVYDEESAAGTPYAVTFSVKDVGGQTLAAAAGSLITVGDAPLSGGALLVPAVEGQPLAGGTIVASFTDADPKGTLADYSATINWGDGTITPAVLITAAGSQSGVTYSVIGSHTYAQGRTYPLDVTITDSGGATTVAGSTADVADAPLLPAALPPVPAVEAVALPVTVPVASFTDSNPAATISDFTATIDWGDGTPQSAGTVSQPGGPGMAFVVSGGHTYTDSGVNGGTGTFAISVHVVDDDGATVNLKNTAQVADVPLTLTAQLNPSSDTGVSQTDAITSDNQPNFFGKTEPFAHVVLDAAPASGGAAQPIGQAQAGSDGSWSITSRLLADGIYIVSAGATDQFGHTTTGPTQFLPNVNQGPLVIDTVGPRVTNVEFLRGTGRVSVTIKDVLSGLDLGPLGDASNYALAKPHTKTGTFLVTALPVTPGGVSGPQTVVVQFNFGKGLRGGDYTFVIHAAGLDRPAGIQDVAGNPLDGEFYGTFPSGNGVPGGDFVARLDAIHHKIFPPATVVGFPHPGDPPLGRPRHKFPHTRHAEKVHPARPHVRHLASHVVPVTRRHQWHEVDRDVKSVAHLSPGMPDGPLARRTAHAQPSDFPLRFRPR